MPRTSSGLPRTGAGALYSPELAARESRGGLDKPLDRGFESQRALARGAPDASARHNQAANRVASPPCGALWVPAHSHPAADQRTEVRILDIFQTPRARGSMPAAGSITCISFAGADGGSFSMCSGRFGKLLGSAVADRRRWLTKACASSQVQIVSLVVTRARVATMVYPLHCLCLTIALAGQAPEQDSAS